MRKSSRLALGSIVALASASAACGETGAASCSPADASCVYVVEAMVARAPQNHRATAASCPASRGPGSLSASCDYDAGPPLPCLDDTECTMGDDGGKNGRCLPAPPVTCDTACSYDQCFEDSDCTGNVPCGCRDSASSSAPNLCLTGSTCRLDSDCGEDGFCSPNGSGTPCPDAYHCHTPNDACLDNGDCPSGQGCNYDLDAETWRCGSSCSQPP